MNTNYESVLLALPTDYIIALAMLVVACFISARAHGMERPVAALYVGSTAIALTFLSFNIIESPPDSRSIADQKGAVMMLGLVASMSVMFWFKRTYKIYKKLYWNILIVINDTMLCLLVISIITMMMNLPAVSAVSRVNLMFECVIYFMLCVFACLFGSFETD